MVSQAVSVDGLASHQAIINIFQVQIYYYSYIVIYYTLSYLRPGADVPAVASHSPHVVVSAAEDPASPSAPDI